MKQRGTRILLILTCTGAVGAGIGSLMVRWANAVMVLPQTSVSLALVAVECSTTESVRDFAAQRSVIVIPSEHHTSRGHELCEEAINKLGVRYRLAALILGPRRACQRLTAETELLAVERESPFFVGPSGEDEATKTEDQKFQLEQQLEALRAR